MLALLIERIPLTSEAKTHKVLHICTRFQLKEQGEEDDPLYGSVLSDSAAIACLSGRV